MQCEIMRHPMRFGWTVRFWESTTAGARLWIPPTGSSLVGKWVDVSHGNVPSDYPHSLQLDDGMLDALVRAAQPHTAPVPATVRHLEDALAMRDRLLVLVERAHPSL